MQFCIFVSKIVPIFSDMRKLYVVLLHSHKVSFNAIMKSLHCPQAVCSWGVRAVHNTHPTMFCILTSAELSCTVFCKITPHDLILQVVRINTIQKQRNHSVLSNQNHYATEYNCKRLIWTFSGMRSLLNKVV